MSLTLEASEVNHWSSVDWSYTLVVHSNAASLDIPLWLVIVSVPDIKLSAAN
jgi:hypothetical protein